ncbi:GAF domain-containing SpoIIE family protein phosphatase [Streptomyces sp. NBC_00370]|uniref:GAF domain-containing SpoIIE family protein phosphatase n=1 Tax=Streptomyces sp. NBC_00370 TaxID=2975728 RepID=UPI002E26F84C
MATEDESGTAALSRVERLLAVRETGLSAAADADMERFARLVARMVGVPVALVSLVEEDRQVFPGMVGLPEPWATRRQTPLSHSLCRHVLSSQGSFVVEDAREERSTCASTAIPQLGVVAYAGVPLTDDDGNVLGALCAVDTVPRAWTSREVQDLRDLAAACSAELRLRIASAQGAVLRRRADELAAVAGRALTSAELLLRAAEDLTDTAGLEEVRLRVGDLVSGDLKPSYVSLLLAENHGGLHRLLDRSAAPSMEVLHEYVLADADFPTARALRERRMVTVPDRAHLQAVHGPAAVGVFDSLGLGSAVCLPLLGARGPLGVLVLGWSTPHEIDMTEASVLTTVAGYTAQAVERALFLDERIDVAHQLQQAMLTTLPDVPGLELAALYRPASSTDMVGGDWYDAFSLPRPGNDASLVDDLAVTVGDITGHDVQAATLMGQTRSMLRQAAATTRDQGPAAAMSALEDACRTLPVEVSGTLVHGHLRRVGDAWALTWVNAGHPPPLVLLANGTVCRLDEHGILLHHRLGPFPRHDLQTVLEPGSTLLLYTDGLIERPGQDFNTAVDRAAHLLAAADSDIPLPALLEHLADEVCPGEPGDDVVLLAVRVPRAEPSDR